MEKQKKYYFIVVLGALSVSMIIQFTIPFPFGFGIALIFYVSLPYILKYIAKKKLGGSFAIDSMTVPKLVKTCLVCNFKTNKDPCPRCGQRQFSYK